MVSKVTPGSRAEQAGLRGGDRPVRYGRSIIYLGGDIIVEVDNVTIHSLHDLLGALEDNKPGETVEVVVYRGRNKKTLYIKLSDRPKQLSW